jgi:hypothetical protein
VARRACAGAAPEATRLDGLTVSVLNGNLQSFGARRRNTLAITPDREDALVFRESARV